MNKSSLIICFLLFITSSKAQTLGCTDIGANNYNSSATKNDGSCIYNAASITPSSSFIIDSSIKETSGLIAWNNQIWTINDSEDTSRVYTLDTINGKLIRSYSFGNKFNDCEEIAQDDDYIYIGDFGNNENGNRKDLKIVRIKKHTLLLNSIVIDTINFSYSNQSDYTPSGSNNTDFDCEAFIVTNDSIFLFSKQWLSGKTSIYSLSKKPGTYIANLKSTYDVQGLITGATYIELKKLIVLTGYSNLLQPFFYLLYDFDNSDYFSGNKRKISISLPFHQVEGVATTNGLKYYVSNEFFSKPPIVTVPQKFHIIDLNPFLDNYISTKIIVLPRANKKNKYIIYPIPSTDLITVKTNGDFSQENYTLTNLLGQLVLIDKLTKEDHIIDISVLQKGEYVLTIGKESFKIIKR